MAEKNTSPLVEFRPDTDDPEGHMGFLGFVTEDGPRVYKRRVGDSKMSEMSILVNGPRDPYEAYVAGHLIEYLRGRTPDYVLLEGDETVSFEDELDRLKRLWLEDMKVLDAWLAAHVRQIVQETEAEEYLHHVDY